MIFYYKIRKLFIK